MLANRGIQYKEIMLPPPIHVAGPSNPLLTSDCAADCACMTGTLTGVGPLWNGCFSADKGQVSSPSAALMGRANSDPSPVEHQPGQSIVSNRAPAFRVTSPSLLPEEQPAHESMNIFSKGSNNAVKACVQLYGTPLYIVIISPYG